MDICLSNSGYPGGKNEYRKLPSLPNTYHLAFGRKHVIEWIVLVVGAAADPFSPDSSQLVLSLTKKPHYLHHVLYVFRLRLGDMLMVCYVLNRILCGNRVCSCDRNISLTTFTGRLFPLFATLTNIIPRRRKLGGFLRSCYFKLWRFRGNRKFFFKKPLEGYILRLQETIW